VIVLRREKKRKNIDSKRISYFTHPPELDCLFLDDAVDDIKLPWLRARLLLETPDWLTNYNNRISDE
jgi:hypothetical protein